MARSINKAGLNLIKSFEGCQLKSYKCPAGVWTIGWGTTGDDIVEGLVWTQAYADLILEKDLAAFANKVDKLVNPPISDNMFDALVSFAYNCGINALAGSTLLKMVNRGDYVGASLQFERWNKANGKVLPGLTRRRLAEKALFLS